MHTKSTLLLSTLALMMLVNCSGITARPDAKSVALHNGQVYYTEHLSLEIVPVDQGLKIFSSVPLSHMRVSDGHYSYEIEKSNHSLHLVRKKNYILAEGNFVHNKSYRVHLKIQHDGLDEDVTLKINY